ncbi:putative GTP-binding protein [Leptomonas seymouri]|uniref:Putative GTP-binding protein n=1 Tax=Leptomonas seymouri TaxID=5684 RepID=A0A0N1HU31_LEPSE|nr:putative GTP-binding protein [Leptomonas seymouri]|eukprot:KPI84765.1 putative GTP-binding protein [Leptomonas seymouri]
MERHTSLSTSGTGHGSLSAISIVVVGGGGVGKSCLTIQYAQGHFVEQYDATIEDVYRKAITLDNVPAVLTVVDTAGQDAFHAVRDQHLRKGKAFVLVYSITDAESFSHIRRIYSSLQRARMGRPTPCVLVGNKVDEEAYREVSHHSGAQLAAEINAPFLEVTAKDNRMCEQVFEKLVHTLRSGCCAVASGDGAEGGSKTAADGVVNANTATPRGSSSRGASATTTGVAGDGSTKSKGRRRRHKCTLQ